MTHGRCHGTRRLIITTTALLGLGICSLAWPEPRAPGSGGRPVAARIARLMGTRLEIARGRARRRVPGFGVEEGGFAKGIALREAAAAALEAEAISVFIDLGGQLMAAGDAPPRTVGVAHPRRRQDPVVWLELSEGSLATTGNSERSTVVSGREVGHVVDPATGVPLQDWGSVTVLSRDPVAADCLATALYVMGPELGPGWVRQRADVEALFVVAGTQGVELIATDGIAGSIETTEPSVARSATASEAVARRGDLDDQERILSRSAEERDGEH